MRRTVLAVLLLAAVVPAVACAQPPVIKEAKGGIVDVAALVVFGLLSYALAKLVYAILSFFVETRRGTLLLISALIVLGIWAGMVWLINTIDKYYPSLRPYTWFFKWVIDGALRAIGAPTVFGS